MCASCWSGFGPGFCKPTSISTIRAALEKFEEQTGIATRFVPQGNGSPLEPAAESQVMHIVQESLSNIRKHAHARQVTVTATASARRPRGSGRRRWWRVRPGQ